MYSTNDWRYYLAHGWGTTPEQKAKERAYNTEYYQTHKYKWYGETKPDGSVVGYFDVNPGGEYESDNNVTVLRKKTKNDNSNPARTYMKYVSKAYKRTGSTKKKSKSSKRRGYSSEYLQVVKDPNKPNTYNYVGTSKASSGNHQVFVDPSDSNVQYLSKAPSNNRIVSGTFSVPSSGNHQKFVDVNPRTTPTYSYYELVKKKV